MDVISLRCLGQNPRNRNKHTHTQKAERFILSNNNSKQRKLSKIHYLNCFLLFSAIASPLSHARRSVVHGKAAKINWITIKPLSGKKQRYTDFVHATSVRESVLFRKLRMESEYVLFIENERKMENVFGITAWVYFKWTKGTYICFDITLQRFQIARVRFTFHTR